MNKLTISALIIAVFVALTAVAQKSRVEVRLRNIGYQTIQLAYLDGDQQHTVEVIPKDNKFIWEPPIAHPTKVFLVSGTQSKAFYIEPGKMLMQGSADSLINVRLTGSKMQEEADRYELGLERLKAKEREITLRYRTQDEALRAAAEKDWAALQGEKFAVAEKYIVKNPKSYFSLLLLNDLEDVSEYTDVKRVYSKLDPKLLETPTGKILGQKIGVMGRGAIGAQIVDFTQNDMFGNPVKLSDYKGKYLLIDFWASWCAPCRAENPLLVKEYAAYKDRGFAILGVSIDNIKANWEKAVTDDQLPWTQLSDLKGWKNEISTYYGVTRIPNNLLIDPSGKIIARDLTGAALSEKLAEIFTHQ